MPEKIKLSIQTIDRIQPIGKTLEFSDLLMPELHLSVSEEGERVIQF